LKLVPLVETTRGTDVAHATVENVHYGAVAVVDLHGEVLAHAGDPHYLTYTRSALKPLQALPLVEDQGIASLGLESADLAMFCASHSGEPRHVERVHNILERIGMGEPDLQCGCQVPVYYSTVAKKAPADGHWTQLHHNCSGKHSGMLAWCRLHGVAHHDYLDPAHALQQRIRARLSPVFGVKADQIALGIDGCSAPNYALPLSSLAHFYARLAQGAGDPEHGDAFGQIFAAMTDFPGLVSGEMRADDAYMTSAPGDWIAKAGADGVQVLASRQRGIGIAVKIGDGAPRAINTAMLGVLDQLGMATEKSRAATERWREPVIKNYKGLAVGSVRCATRLHLVKPEQL
jgi:L-asparaginase II